MSVPRQRRGLALIQNKHTNIIITLINYTTVYVTKNTLTLIRELRNAYRVLCRRLLGLLRSKFDGWI